MTLESRSRLFSSVAASAVFSAADGSNYDAEEGIAQAVWMLDRAAEAKGCVYVLGNGGSAAVASHAVTDFMNAAGIRAITLHDPALLTCLSNDYGYETAFSKTLSAHLRPEDLTILISSSGRSKNMLMAAATVRRVGGALMTLTGFAPDNPLRGTGDLNIWLNSAEYGPVEIGHLFLLHHLSDVIVHAKKSDNPSK